MSKLTLYNTLTRQKEKFVPLIPGQVSMYVCGITIYDDIHIGHLKSIATFEWLRGYFKATDHTVKFVRNFTDIDDKIIAKAIASGTTVKALTDGYIDTYRQLMAHLGLPPADEEPRVSEYLPQISHFISDLLNQQFAYASDDGIYFDTQRRRTNKLPLSGQRPLSNTTEHSKHKNHPNDFALWKKDVTHGYPSNIFEHLGRPGWHIECSAMHHALLGSQFDIHGGGRDLIFPHHENEIAQSEAHNGITPARVWMHNGMMTKDGQKISKSGTPIHVKDLLLQYSPEALLFFLLKGHYRQSQELNDLEMQDASEKMTRFRRAVTLSVERSNNEEHLSLSTLSKTVPTSSFYSKALDALADDLDTPSVVVLFNAALIDLERTLDIQLAKDMLRTLTLLRVFPQNTSVLTLSDAEKHTSNTEIPDFVATLYEQRLMARKTSNWAEADRLRLLIHNVGFEIKDTPDNSLLIRRPASFRL